MVSNQDLLKALESIGYSINLIEKKLEMPRNTIYNLKQGRHLNKYPNLRIEILKEIKSMGDKFLLIHKYADTDYYPSTKTLVNNSQWYLIQGKYYFYVDGIVYCTELMEINFNGKIIKFNKLNSGPLVIG